MASFTQLATELLWIIVDSFSQRDLHSCTLVNKQLYIATNHLLWRFRQLPDGDTTDIILSKATTEYHPVGQWLQKLEICSYYWTDIRLFDLIDNSNLDHLEELHLDNTMNLTDQSVIHLARRSPTLKQVHLFKLPNITQRFMYALGDYCLQLNKLVLNDCTGVGGDSYSALQNCPIQVMHISKPPAILQTEMAMWDLIVHYPLLTELELTTDGTRGRLFMEQLLTAAAGAWPYLTTLALGNYGPPPLSTSYIERYEENLPLVVFLTHHQCIERLHFHLCDVSDDDWNYIADLGLPCLEELNIDNIRQVHPRTICRLVHACPRLSSFTFPPCEDLRSLFLQYQYSCPDLADFIRIQLPPRNLMGHLDQEHLDKIRDSGFFSEPTMATSIRATVDTPPRTSRGAISLTPRTTTPTVTTTLSRTRTTDSSHTTADTPRRLALSTHPRATMATASRTPRTTAQSRTGTLPRSMPATSSRTIATTFASSRTAAVPSPAPMATTLPRSRASARRTTATSSNTATTPPSRALSATPRATATSSRTAVAATPSLTATPAAPRSRMSAHRTTATSFNTATSAPSRTATSAPSRTTTTSLSRAISATSRTRAASSQSTTTTPRPTTTTPRSTTMTPRSTTMTPRAMAAPSRRATVNSHQATMASSPQSTATTSRATANSSRTTAPSARTLTTIPSKPTNSFRTTTSTAARATTFSLLQKSRHF